MFHPQEKFQGSDSYHFPANEMALFGIICSLSFLIAFILAGNQIFFANWGVVDDWKSFIWLGPDKNLPFSEIWNTLLTKTEVGVPAGRFRPCYYFLKIVETAVWGTNVHLWYFTRTLEFTVFIASIWWITSRFVGIWLGAILLVPILVMPFWADVWARLAHRKPMGAPRSECCSSRLTAFSPVGARPSTLGAIAITVATIILVGVKETFVPFAGLSVTLLLVACARQLLSLPLAGLLVAVICTAGGAIILFVEKTVAGGTDYYSNSLAFSPLVTIARSSFVHTISYWVPVYLAEGLSLAMVVRSQGQTLRRWATASSVTAAIFIFLVAMYVSQCVAYRSHVPLNMRYDFPRGALCADELLPAVVLRGLHVADRISRHGPTGLSSASRSCRVTFSFRQRPASFGLSTCDSDVSQYSENQQFFWSCSQSFRGQKLARASGHS